MDYGIVSFIGKFHPLLVHLPIGMLLIAILFGFMSVKEEYAYLRGANHIVLFLSAVSATLSAFTGWVLSQSGGYSGSLVSWHQWMGISLTVVAWLAFFIHSRNESVFKAALTGTGLLLVITGHLGGTITHGDGFLIPPPPSDWFTSTSVAVDPIAVNREMLGYEAVANIVDRKCKSCHGQGNQEAGLRLDSPEAMMEGGEHGTVLRSAGTESLLTEHILLPIEDEDHMPPKDKSQLSKAEMALLVKWMETGASFDATIEELGWSDSLLQAYNEAVLPKEVVYAYIPETGVQPVKAELVERLDTLGVSIVPVADGSNYVSVNLLHVPAAYLDEAFELLPALAEQCIWLDLTAKELKPEHLAAVGRLNGLIKLNLKDCRLADDQMKALESLKGLQYLNLVNNAVTVAGLENLKTNEGVQQLFLYQTGVSNSDSSELRRLFPNALIDVGGYDLPLIEADTSKIIY